MKNTPKFLQLFILGTGLLTMSSSYAHDGHVSVSVENGQRCFTSNSLPDHSTGTFPNSNNPTAIKSQDVRMCVSTTPKKGANPVMHKGSIGIGINGVQFRPGTADYYDASSRRGHSKNPSSGWKVEGLNPANMLGMDSNNAHVGPNGLYHYHGVAGALYKSAGAGPIGYAADGFPIYYAGNTQRSSYKLKQGTRPSGPGGAYDGTYEEDFSYIAGSGSLDQCNGATINGKFAYFATEAYPFLPRCMWGQVSADFKGHAGGDRQQRGNRQQGGNANRAMNSEGRGNGNSNRQGRPRAAMEACRSLAENAACSFTAPRRNIQIDGSCQQTPRGMLACKR